MKAKRWSILTTCAVGIAACVVILSTGPEPLEASMPERKPQVTIGALERSTTANTVTAFGTLKPRQTLELTTQVPGEVVWVSDDLEAGRLVEAGAPLLRVDDRDYAIAVASVEARYAQAEANIALEEGRAEIARLEWSAWQRTQDDDTNPNPLALREPQRAEAIARRSAIGAERDAAQLALQRTEIRAPWRASVVDARAIEGQILRVGKVTASLLPVDYAFVELQVPAKTTPLLSQGIDRIELWPVHDRSAAPVLGEFDGVVRTLSETTRLATIRLRINDPLRHPGWAYGMHVEARLVAKTQHAVAEIPADLIVSGNLIWVYRNGKAERHQLFPVDNAGSIVTVQDNFDDGDALIVERPIGLFDGAPVEISTTAQAVGPAARTENRNAAVDA